MPNPNLPINFRKNTYIGARYVPKFSVTPGSEWDNSIQYEPLTIVLYQGNSYTSKTFVPVGVDINNDTYWANTGNYNAQVESYREEVVEVKNDVEEIQQNINNKKTCCLYIGNSYTVGNGETGLRDETKDLWDSQYLAAEGGVGFYPYAGHPSTYTDRLENAINTPGVNNSIITHVLFISAMGDSRALAENYQGYINQMDNIFNNIVSLCKENFPKLQRIMVVLAETRNQVSFSDSPYYSLYDTHYQFSQHLKKSEIEYLGWIGWDALMNPSLLSNDNYHPSTLGYKVLGAKLKQAIISNFKPTPYRIGYSQSNVIWNGENLKTSVRFNYYPDSYSINFQYQSSPFNYTSGNLLEIDFKNIGIPIWVPYLEQGGTNPIIVTNGNQFVICRVIKDVSGCKIQLLPIEPKNFTVGGMISIILNGGGIRVM